MMLGYLLARDGVNVTVVEKHNDFFRDFRGDTVHPSTLEVLHELGLLNDFLKLPHQRITSAGGIVGDFQFEAANFSHVPARCKFVALMPQWDFLNFLSGKATELPTFELRMQHEVMDLIREGDQIAGVITRGFDGRTVRVLANLVVGCDGRHSVTRRIGQLAIREFGVPIDVLWFRISRRPEDPAQVLGNVNYGKALILINRSDYFQAGLIIPKGSFDAMKERGLDEFKKNILQIAPYLGGRVDELREWEQVKILTVRINRLTRWYRPGLLCIGDAAHAMSPAGGVGINLAIQDAVATANLLTKHLQRGEAPEAALAAVQRRREFPTRVTQAVQAGAHRAFARIFANLGPVKVGWQFRLAVRIPGIHRALGYAIGMGMRPEHVQDKNVPMRRVPSVIARAIVIGVGVVVGIVALRALRRA
jgi:2-polyprenyl-6-methoxyphenol hydroxylase-like FAD-dependent oxidoreductase